MSAPQLPTLPYQLPKTQAEWGRFIAALQNWQQILAAPVWQTPTLGTSIANYGSGYATAAYCKDSTGRVQLRGVIAGSGLTAGVTIFTLPAVYCPPAAQVFVGWGFNTAATICRLNVTSAGAVVYDSATNGNPTTYMSLGGVSFQTY